ncbi:GH1 family beta-glucosidase [Flavobacterium sp.]|uniref:GH1 family beta-glucosidase n=1 Tax=Flavobacterium sp. TaxID=239 RepID=UPI00262FBF9B|nr:GH1 family beta-glucosidase [Flavobacterium sp.]
MDKKLHVDFSKQQFGADFKWGVSTAAFQIEGSKEADGKGLSIWDVFATRRGKIKNGHQPADACDFYNRYKDDIALVRELNISNFRFSLSWTRLLPEGTGSINYKGVDYYNRVIDFLLKCGITPWVTIYHWDLPHALELRGGWTNRDIVSWFSDYSEICALNFGDRVINWMVLNEPSVFTGAGYFLGMHAPGKKGLTNYLKAMHHATLATAAGAKALRKQIDHAHIGTTFSCTHIEPLNSSERNVLAANRVDTLLNRTFIEPILGLGYPHSDLPFLKKIEKYMQPDDEKNMAFDFDFTGIQCYTREIVKASLFVPYIGASIVKASKRKVPSTEMNWEVYPPAIYQMIKKFNGYKGIKQLIITENGAAFPDVVENGKVNDTDRTTYLQNHMSQVLKAKQEGYPVEGYFVWTLTDNFEWAEGFHPRFGLVYVDFDTQERTIKQSGLWFQQFLK